MRPRWIFRPSSNKRWATIEERGWEADWFAMPTLAGTYLETAKHLIHGRAIDRSGSAGTLLRQCHHRPDSVRSARAHHRRRPGSHRDIAANPAMRCSCRPDGKRIVTTATPSCCNRLISIWTRCNGSSIAASRFLAEICPASTIPSATRAQGVNMVLFGAGAMILAPLVNLGTTSVDPRPADGPADSARRFVRRALPRHLSNHSSNRRSYETDARNSNANLRLESTRYRRPLPLAGNAYPYQLRGLHTGLADTARPAATRDRQTESHAEAKRRPWRLARFRHHGASRIPARGRRISDRRRHCSQRRSRSPKAAAAKRAATCACTTPTSASTRSQTSSE